jgi:hypothetical protein
MTPPDCKSCSRYIFTTSPGGWLELCGPDGRSIAFMRAEIGIYGEKHCGPEGKLWRERA